MEKGLSLIDSSNRRMDVLAKSNLSGDSTLPLQNQVKKIINPQIHNSYNIIPLEEEMQQQSRPVPSIQWMIHGYCD